MIKNGNANPPSMALLLNHLRKDVMKRNKKFNKNKDQMLKKNE